MCLTPIPSGAGVRHRTPPPATFHPTATSWRRRDAMPDTSGGRPTRDRASGGAQTDINVLTPSDSIAAPAPRATTTPRSITTYASASSAAKS